MVLRTIAAVAIGLSVLIPQMAFGEQAAAPAAPYPLDEIPDAMPFGTPYGAPISLERANGVIAAAVEAAKKRGWQISIAVVDSSGSPVAFARMDGANMASADLAQGKARTSIRYRRPTKVFEDAIQKKDFKYLLSLEGIVASRGGIPLVEDGKMIGAIGCSGGTGSQDEAVCASAAATVNK